MMAINRPTSKIATLTSIDMTEEIGHLSTSSVRLKTSERPL